MKIAPVAGEIKSVSAGVARGMCGGNRRGTMQWLLDVAGKMDEITQVDREITLGEAWVLQVREADNDGLNDIRGQGHKVGGGGSIEAEWQVNVVRSARVERALEIIGPCGRRHEIAGAGAAQGSQIHRDQRVAARLRHRIEMIVGDLGHEHVAFGVPGPHGQLRA